MQQKQELQEHALRQTARTHVHAAHTCAHSNLTWAYQYQHTPQPSTFTHHFTSPRLPALHNHSTREHLQIDLAHKL